MLRTKAIFERKTNDFQPRDCVLEKIIEIADSNIEIVSEATTSELNDFVDLQKLEAKYFNATPRVKEIVSRRIERGDISKAVKKANNYECQICKALGLNSHGFKKRNGEFYPERAVR